MPLFNAGLLIGGKYRVIRRIGAGGMGAVFEVENTALGGRAALKVLTINIHDQPEYFARFQNEASRVCAASATNSSATASEIFFAHAGSV